MLDPAETLLRFFPRAMLNFDQAPPGTPPGSLGPLHAIFQQAGQVLANFQADALLAQGQLSVQTAAGSYLDAHGLLYGVARQATEPDITYRPRVLLAANTGKLTIAAITAALDQYYAPSAFAHAVTVFDRQSNPSRAASLGIVPFNFVSIITTQVPVARVFFADRSSAGRGTYVIAPDDAWQRAALFAGRSCAGAAFARSRIPARVRRFLFAGRSFVGRSSAYMDNRIPTFDSPTDASVIATVLRTKAGGTHPLYLFGRTLVPTHPDTRAGKFLFAGRRFAGRADHAAFAHRVFPQFVAFFASRSFISRNSFIPKPPK